MQLTVTLRGLGMGILMACLWFGVGCKRRVVPVQPGPPPQAIALGTPKDAGSPPIDGGSAAEARTLGIEQEQLFVAQLRQARRAQAKGQFGEALVLLDAALRLKPSDPAALSEQSWTAFLAGNLDLAERAARQCLAVLDALDRNGRRYEKAAAYYNLGRTLEQRGDKDGAISAYQFSLAYRYLRDVQTRLFRLDQEAVADFEAMELRPEPLIGPKAQLGQFCPELDIAWNGPIPSVCLATREPRETTERPWSVQLDAAPFLEARVVEAVGEDIDAHGLCFLAVRIGSGWFLRRQGFVCREPSFLEQTVQSFEILYPDSGTKIPMLSLILNNDRFMRGHYKLDGEVRHDIIGPIHHTEQLLCGVGASGKPSCIDLETSAEKGPISVTTWSLLLQIPIAGILDIKAKGKLTDSNKQLPGRHVLIFP